MKEINGQLYGYSYELDTTSESDGTKCFAVDTGTVFVAYKGVWYEQPGSFWAASISEGEDDLYKTSWEINKIVPADDLLIVNAVDTGKRYVSFNGAWYAQPVQWSAPASGGGGGGGGSDSGVFIINLTYDPETEEPSVDKTYNEITVALESGKVIGILYEGRFIDYTYPVPNGYQFVALTIDPGSGSVWLLNRWQIVINSDGTISDTGVDFTLTART